MKKAFLARQDFDDRAEALDVLYRAVVDFTRFGHRHDSPQDCDCGFGVGLIGRRDGYVTLAVSLFNLDRRVRVALNALNDLASRPDDRTDEFCVDRELRQAWSEW
jgi:hypothetical protein